MLSGDFQRKIHQLNPTLRIFCGNDDSKAAGLFHVVNGEYMQIIGVDKNELPPHIMYDQLGHILKCGWRRVVKYLIKKKLIDRRRAEKAFSFRIGDRRRNPGPPVYVDPVRKEIDTIVRTNLMKTGHPFMLSTDEVMDISKEIRSQTNG